MTMNPKLADAWEKQLSMQREIDLSEAEADVLYKEAQAILAKRAQKLEFMENLLVLKREYWEKAVREVHGDMKIYWMGSRVTLGNGEVYEVKQS